MRNEEIIIPDLAKSSKLDQPYKVEGTMAEARNSFYELARKHVRLMDNQEFSAWFAEFGKWAVRHAGYTPASVVVWPRRSEKIGDENKKEITHFEIGVNKDKFQIDGEDYSDIMPFAIEHEMYEAWLNVKKGLGDVSEEKEDGMKNYLAKHELALRREFMLAEQQGLGEKLFQWHIKFNPKEEEKCRNVLEKIRQRLKK